MIRNTIWLLAAITVIVGMLAACTEAQAEEISLQVDWAYNGPHDGGFRLYHQPPDGAAEVVVFDIADGTARTWTGLHTLSTGVHSFELLAYTGDEESPRSEPFEFEYIEPQTPGNPAPTLIIRFN